jgi:valyl-tRNA synthetase
MTDPMPTAYDPRAIEPGWAARWEEARLFVADAGSPKQKYTIALPPPNVTGELHLGHALNGALQDVWARYRRMTGYEVLWLPGTDHAAIATQNVIEKQLAREGTTKESIGRAAFEELVEEWYRNVGATIVTQFHVLGASLDMTRLRFTMDPDYVRAVRTAFVLYYDKGWLYRGPRIVNWCPYCLSAISDLEIEWRTHEDTLYYISYPIEGSDETLTIATVRPETMLADTGVAVHPDDERYRHLVGKFAVLPLVGRRLPIVADEAVQKDFGTGALKVTPGHDLLDYEIGERHGLELVNGMNLDGTMKMPDLPRYDGLPGVEARTRVVEDLQAAGRLVRAEPYTHEVAHCDRSGTVLEPLVSEQWFLDMKELARMCVEASAKGKVRWHPERYERTYLDWLKGIRDWCVSRQLWLGHRIPVYTCANGHQFAAVDRPLHCKECDSTLLSEETDVLDTWFSSALWPFATLGWPEQTEDLKAFYPTALNCTNRDIINLWVTRMIFSGLFFMGEAPFSDVIVHATVQAADGRRMSKSLGTGVDPREVIDVYGADALRAWGALVGMATQDARFDVTRIEAFKRFANKLWNATRLVLSSIANEPPLGPPAVDGDLRLEDRWILSRLQEVADRVRAGIEGYYFGGSIDALYEFGWHELCDWYLEAIKPRLRDGDPAARSVAAHSLDVLFRLLHPFMPFITEELWHHLPFKSGFLVQSSWPEREIAFVDPVSEADFHELKGFVSEIRTERKVRKAALTGGWIELRSARSLNWRELLEELASVQVVDKLDGQSLDLSEGRVRFPFAESLDSQRAQGMKVRLESELTKVEAKLGNPAFRERAPAEIVAKEEQKASELRAALARLT